MSDKTLYYKKTKQESLQTLTSLIESILDKRLPMGLTIHFDGNGSYKTELVNVRNNVVNELLRSKNPHITTDKKEL